MITTSDMHHRNLDKNIVEISLNKQKMNLTSQHICDLFCVQILLIRTKISPINSSNKIIVWNYAAWKATVIKITAKVITMTNIKNSEKYHFICLLICLFCMHVMVPSCLFPILISYHRYVNICASFIRIVYEDLFLNLCVCATATAAVAAVCV